MSTAALSYPLGRPVLPAARVRRVRLLPAGVAPLVSIGDQVRPEQTIAAAAGGDEETNVVLAGLAGRVTEVVPEQWIAIEGVASLAHGIVGVGGAVVGQLSMLARGESLAVVPIPRGGVILFPQQVPLTLLQRAVAGGAVGIIAASASARELEAFARADLSAILDGLAHDTPVALTVVLTEGLGNRTMSPLMVQLLSARVNDTVLINGTTLPRRNVRPEVLLPLPLGTAAPALPLDDALAPGVRVQVANGARRGAQGVIVHLFRRHQHIEPGLMLPIASVRFDDGSSANLPLHALDRIG